MINYVTAINDRLVSLQSFEYLKHMINNYKSAYKVYNLEFARYCILLRIYVKDKSKFRIDNPDQYLTDALYARKSEDKVKELWEQIHNLLELHFITFTFEQQIIISGEMEQLYEKK